MDIEEINSGNLIKVFPRENQEGLLAVKEIQPASIICEMISPRKGYLFRIKPAEMNPVPLTSELLRCSGYLREDENSTCWTDSRGKINFCFDNGDGRFSLQDTKPVRYMHEFQNEYSRLTGTELIIEY